MGFLCKQGRIRMKVVVGLLIVIGAMMLRESEGIKCYQKLDGENETTVDCEALPGPSRNWTYNVCSKHSAGNLVTKMCGSVPPILRECMDQIFGAGNCFGMVNRTTFENEDKLKQCVDRGNRTAGQDGLMNMRNFRESGGRTSGKSDVSFEKECWCFTDLCNPAGRSSANAQFIIGVLVAASLHAFNTVRGSLYI